MSVFYDLVLSIAGLLGIIAPNYDETAISKGLHECTKATRRRRKALKNATTIGDKQHLEACQRNIKSLRCQFNNMRKTGKGLSKRKETARDRVLGMMKDENHGVPMTKYVGLRSKLYATKVLVTEADMEKTRKKMQDDEYDEDEIMEILNNFGVTKKAKGVKSSVVKTLITFEDYIKCLENREHMVVSQNLIRSQKHQVHTIIQNKIALSYEDDKRYLIPGTDNTLPWGHYSIDSNMDVD